MEKVDGNSLTFVIEEPDGAEEAKQSFSMDFTSSFKSKKTKKGKKAKKILEGEEVDQTDDVNRDLEDELLDDSITNEVIEIPRNLKITTE